jgi:DNA-binding NarL/FixJ family response regulator
MTTANEEKITVFLVDDSFIVRERLRSMLADLSHVTVVGEADIDFEAIKGIRRHKPAVVVLDISMPGGSGLHVLEAVKKESSPPLVIMLTNFPQEQYRQKSRKFGAEYFFDKSTEFERVVEVLRGLGPPAPAAPCPAPPAAGRGMADAERKM